MKLKKNIMGIFMLIIFLIASFFTGVNYNSHKKQNQNRKSYINQLYHGIDNTIILLSSAENWGNSINSTDLTVNQYSQLLMRLNTMKVMSEQAFTYLRDDNYSYLLNNIADSFDWIERGVGSGIISNDQLICYDFLNDGIISNNEISFLNSLKEDLQNIKNDMYSEKTKQENPNLSMEELSQIFKPFTDKYNIINLHNIGLKN